MKTPLLFKSAYFFIIFSLSINPDLKTVSENDLCILNKRSHGIDTFGQEKIFKHEIVFSSDGSFKQVVEEEIENSESTFEKSLPAEEDNSEDYILVVREKISKIRLEQKSSIDQFLNIFDQILASSGWYFFVQACSFKKENFTIGFVTTHENHHEEAAICDFYHSVKRYGNEMDKTFDSKNRIEIYAIYEKKSLLEILDFLNSIYSEYQLISRDNKVFYKKKWNEIFYKKIKGNHLKNMQSIWFVNHHYYHMLVLFEALLDFLEGKFDSFENNVHACIPNNSSDIGLDNFQTYEDAFDHILE